MALLTLPLIERAKRISDQRLAALLTICWYLTSGIHQFFKQPLLLTSLTTLPD